jgi:hypothetical protein
MTIIAGIAFIFCTGLLVAPIAMADAGASRPATLAVDADIAGYWKIQNILDYADITAISARQARGLIGKIVIVYPDKFVFNGEVCDQPSYSRSIEDTAKSMREKGHVSSANMGLPNTVTVIHVGCTDLFLKRPGLIVVHWDGYYFDAVRIKN